MKKYITVFTAVILCLVFVTGIVFSFEFSGQFNPDEQANKSELQTTEPANKDNLKITVNTNANNHSAIALFTKNFDVNNITYEEYITIESYINLMMVHNLSPNEVTEINNLIANGTPIGTIWDIYEFYLTTNDDFSVISKIAAYEERYYGKNWIENAYNDITQNKHGVIEKNEAQNYLKTFTNSEILYANVLSRKGVFTIDEILNKHKNGETWSELTKLIYSGSSEQKAVGSVKERLDIENYLKNNMFDYDSSPFEVHKFAFFCATNNVDISDALVTGENVGRYYNEVCEKLDDVHVLQTSKALADCGLPKSYMTIKEYEEYNSKYHKAALKEGMSENDIAIMQSKGFSIKEIAESSALFKKDPCAMIKHIKSKRGDMLK